MINHNEAQELHEIVGGAMASGDTRGLARALEIAGVIVSDTEPSTRCFHEAMQIVEDGYQRFWPRTEIKRDEHGAITQIVALEGADSFTDEGGGNDHLECLSCGHSEEIPPGVEVDYR